jgi:hypothetical protein
MKIEMYFERKDPDDGMSEIKYRALQFETRLKPECVKKIAHKHIPGREIQINILGVFNMTTRFRVSLDDANTSAFAMFLYQVMNWEGNREHWTH